MMTPTQVGYPAAAYYRYRSWNGSDVCNKVEWNPSSQWDGYGIGLVHVNIPEGATEHTASAKIMLAISKGHVS